MPEITRLYPDYAQLPLAGAYLAHALRERGTPEAPFVYTNFISSLDGRIAQRDPDTGCYGVPRSIANDLDWRLFLELAAQADAVITSGRRLRELAARGRSLRCVPDLAGANYATWRGEHDLSPFPACIVLSATLDLPYDALGRLEHDELVIVGTAQPSAAQQTALDAAGASYVRVAQHVRGTAVRDLARRRGWRTLYSIGGPKVFYTLAASGMLQRLYLTFAHQLLAGDDYATLLAGPLLRPAVALTLRELNLIAASGDAPQMLLASFDVAPHALQS